MNVEEVIMLFLIFSVLVANPKKLIMSRMTRAVSNPSHEETRFSDSNGEKREIFIFQFS